MTGGSCCGRRITIAIDGPAGAGKSTVARLVARRLGYRYLDTGAMFRAVAWYAIATGCGVAGLTDRQLENLEIGLDYAADGTMSVTVDGRDVTGEIRSSQVTAIVSEVARQPAVRRYLLERQRIMAAGGGIVMDGRDIGSVVLPAAELKIFLTASVTERAARRAREMAVAGRATDMETLLAEITKRDSEDMSRAQAPLVALPTAWYLDTTGCPLEQVVDMVVARAEEVIRSVVQAV
ncbi:MAG: (d)CMP kinase [Negativicutes bacterium]|nr:(d)CMP kinase [Negativicutes bacterium]